MTQPPEPAQASSTTESNDGPSASRGDGGRRRVACIHCGLPVPPGLIDPEAERQFCCGGCKMVYEAIRGCGLDKYYDVKESIGVDERQPGKTTGRGYETFDDESFRKLHVVDEGNGLKRLDLYLEGVHCAACVWLVERLPRVVPGVVSTRLDIRRHVARVTWSDEAVKLSRIARTLDSLGYPSHPYRGGKMHEVRRAEDRRHLIRIGVAAACMMNTMLIAFALYGGMMSGMEAIHRDLFRWSGLGITVIALLWPGRTFFVGALSSFRTRMMHMDVPVAIALLMGTAWGGLNTLRGTGEVYFESLTAVIFLLLIGRWLQHKQQQAAHDSIELLYTLTPSTARLIESTGTIREVPVEALEAGAKVELLAGDSVPADGVLLEGETALDCSLLTGESVPVDANPGDLLHAGTTNLTERIVMEVRQTGAETRVGRLMAMVEQFARERPPIVRLADRVAHYFVFVVLTLAAITTGMWLVLRPDDPSIAIEHAIALLIVTCPCALGLATPLALVAAIGRAARQGILVKGGEIIEQLARPGKVLLDKTGTITRGSITLVEWTGDEAVKPLVLAVESRMSHPLARALCEALGLAESDAARATDPVDDEDVEAAQVQGQGVRGRVGDRVILIGAPAFVTGEIGEAPGWANEAANSAAERGETPVMIAVDGSVKAVAAFGDPPGEDAGEAIDRLRALGWEVGVLSGDHPAAVKAVARMVGIDPEMAEGAADPERKAEVVLAERANGRKVMMIGDGVNDAAALSAADIGVAVHGGAEASLSAADAFLRRPGLGPVVELLEGGHRAVGVIKRNLVVSLAYNVVTASLAIAGLINPLIAAVLMPISSISVVTLSYRSRTF